MIDVQIGKHSEIDFVGQVKWMNEMLVSFLHLNGIKRRDPSGEEWGCQTPQNLKCIYFGCHMAWWRTTIGSIPSPDHFLLLSFCPVPLAQEWLRWLILTSGFPCYIWKFFNFCLLSKYQIHDIVYASSWTFLYFYPTRNDNSKKLQKHLEHRSFTQHFPLAICNAG